MNNLSHEEKHYLYNIIRKDMIKYIKDNNLDVDNYSIFNRSWNDELRKKYGMYENYIGIGEYWEFVDFAKKGIEYEENWQSWLWHRMMGYHFGHVFERKPCNLDEKDTRDDCCICCLGWTIVGLFCCAPA